MSSMNSHKVQPKLVVKRKLFVRRVKKMKPKLDYA